MSPGSSIAGAVLGVGVALVLLMPLHKPVAARPPYAVQTTADVAGEIDALDRIVRALGMRRIALCGAPDGARGASSRARSYTASRACAGDAATADARDIAALEPQAVIFSGTAGDAAKFVATLRADRSFAMVVLASSVDREAFARALPAQARTWIAVADARSEPGDAVPGPRALTLAMLTGPGAHAH
jgi:hypothetical protein